MVSFTLRSLYPREILLGSHLTVYYLDSKFLDASVKKKNYRVGNRRELYVTNWKGFQRKESWPIGEPRGGRGLPGCSTPAQSEIKKKNTDFVGTMISKFIRDSRFSLHQPLKLADDWYNGMLKNII